MATTASTRGSDLRVRLRARHVLTVAGPPIHDGALAVADGRIVDVGPADAVATRHPNLGERDLGDAVVLPGLVDAHCHLEWTHARPVDDAGSFAGWLRSMMAGGATMTPDDFAAAAADGARTARANGTTTMIDSGPTGAGARALRSLGMRGIVHVEAFGRLDGPEAAATADALARRIAALDDPDSIVRIGVSPHAPYTVGPGLWAALARHPGLRDRPWTTHVAESPEELPAICGCDGPLRALFTSRGSEPGHWPGEGSVVARLEAGGALRRGLVCAHCVHLEADDPERLAAAAVGVAHCPVSNTTLAVGRMPLDAVRAAGVPVGLGTDSPATAGRFDLRADARMCVARGDEPADVLELLTLGAARAVGLGDLIGSIEPGKRADLVAFPNPDGREPVTAVIDGSDPPRFAMVDGLSLLDEVDAG